MTEKYYYKRFKPSEIARSFPATADTLLMDTYLTIVRHSETRPERHYIIFVNPEDGTPETFVRGKEL